MKSKRKKSKKEQAPSNSSTKKKSVLSEFFENPFYSSGAFEIILFCFIIGLSFLGGVLFLSSDPPAISWSQDVATDPPQYTYFARNQVLWGQWDLFGHNRFPFFFKSFTTIVSFIVFSIFGTGRFQANLVAVILNLLTLMFLFLALKKVFNQRTAFLSMFFLGINFVFIMYGRNPFLEISASFLIVLGFYFMASAFKKSKLLIPSGICFAASIFFGKTMAAFILPACAAVLLLWAFERFSSDRKVDFKPVAFFGSGFLAVALLWIFFSYLPAKREVAGYLGEQALGLYGFPVALKSLWGFVSNLFTFGGELFYRMPVVFLFSFLGLLLFFREGHSIKELVTRRDHRFKVRFFLVLWFLVCFFLLMILNYRPLRYQFYLIPPLCALAGLWLDSFISSFGSQKKSSPKILFWIVFVVATTFFVNYAITTYHTLSGKQIQFVTSLIISFVITLLIGAFYYWRYAGSKREAQSSNTTDKGWLNFGVRSSMILIFVLISLVVNGKQYLSWASSPTYSLNRASQDLGKILSPEAVISGPYGPALAWDNRLKNIIHMFGVTQPDPELFHTYPITHLALERGGNRDRAFQDYPEVMKNAKILTTYWLRNIPVDIYRIGEWTGNPNTENYPLSDFERAKMLIQGGETDSALILLEEFVSSTPENYSGFLTQADVYFEMGEFEKAALVLEKAAQFNLTDFFVHKYLGFVYINLMNQTGQDKYELLAIDQWEKALKLYPKDVELAAQLRQIKGH